MGANFRDPQEKNRVTFNVMADAVVKTIAEDYFEERFARELEGRIGALVMHEVQSSVCAHVKAAMRALTTESEVS